MTRQDAIYSDFRNLIIDRLLPLVREESEIPESGIFDKFPSGYLTSEILEDPENQGKYVLTYEKITDRVNSELSNRQEVVREIGFFLNLIFPVKYKVINYSPILNTIEIYLSPKAMIGYLKNVELVSTQLVFWGADRKFKKDFPDQVIIRSLFESVIRYPRRER